MSTVSCQLLVRRIVKEGGERGEVGITGNAATIRGDIGAMGPRGSNVGLCFASVSLLSFGTLISS